MKVWLLSLLLFQSIGDLYQSANADMDAGRWVEAATKFEEVLRQDPEHIPSEFNLALCYSKTQKLQQAIDLYRKILASDLTVYEAHINLALLLTGQDAANEFEQAAAIRPDDPKGHWLAGVFYMQQQQVEMAYSHLIKAERLGMATSDLFLALSEAEHSRKNDVQSRAYLEKAAKLDPANRNIRRQLGIVYRESGEFAKAIDALKPLLPDAKLELALSYFDNKNFSEATPLFEELLRSDPNNENLYYVLGKSYMELKQYAKAQLMLSRTLQLNPGDADAYSTMGSIYYIQEDWAHATPYLLKFLDLKPGNAVAHFIVATCYDNLGDIRNAVLHYNKFIELDNGSNDVQSFQARARARTLERRLGK